MNCHSRSRDHMPRAFTLIEVLVVLGIILILTGLLLPSVQSARESARSMACKNRLRQIGLAVANHESTYGFYPSGGWGYQWVGDPSKGTGPNQPGSWAYSLLPYMEAQDVHDLADGLSGSARLEASGKLLQTAVFTYSCPSRPRGAIAPYLGLLPLINSQKPEVGFKIDYAGNAGDFVYRNASGPASDLPQDIAQYPWPNASQITGIFFTASQIRHASVIDGLSNTYLIGEKFVRSREASRPDDRDFGDDQAAFIGDDRDVRRFTQAPPMRDRPDRSEYDRFGSSHPATWNALLGDGSVHAIVFTIETEVHRSLGNRNDGSPTHIPE